MSGERRAEVPSRIGRVSLPDRRFMSTCDRIPLDPPQMSLNPTGRLDAVRAVQEASNLCTDHSTPGHRSSHVLRIPPEGLAIQSFHHPSFKHTSVCHMREHKTRRMQLKSTRPVPSPQSHHPPTIPSSTEHSLYQQSHSWEQSMKTFNSANMTYRRLTKFFLVLFTVLLLTDAYPLHIRQRIRRAIKAPAGKLLAPLEPPPEDTDDFTPKGLIAAEKMVMATSGSAKGKMITVYEETSKKAATTKDRPVGKYLAPLPDSAPPPGVQLVPEQQSGSLPEVAQRWLDLHNQARRAYGATDLKWNWDLARKAKHNADLCTGDHS